MNRVKLAILFHMFCDVTLTLEVHHDLKKNHFQNDLDYEEIAAALTGTR